MEFYTYYVPAKKFSSRELTHLLVSLLVLTVAFSNAFRNGGFLISFLIMLPAVATGFLLHEIMHKVIAQKYGCWAEYRMFPMGLLFALVLSFFGFIFAAPGAVYILGSVTKRENGKIALAGPLTNIVISIVFLPLLFAALPEYFLIPVVSVCMVNSFLALFNLFPIHILDGAKVFRWNTKLWIAVFLLALFLFIVVFVFTRIRLS
jgi:Zn-dependent protease